MKIPLLIGGEILVDGLKVEIVYFDDEKVTLLVNDMMEMDLEYESWVDGRVTVFKIEGVEYAFQTGGRLEGDMFAFRATTVEPEDSVLLEVGMDRGDSVEYSDRLAFKFVTGNEDSVLLSLVDPFADKEMGHLLLRDDDTQYDEGGLIVHTATTFLVQGRGEVDGMFHFRVAELTFPKDDSATGKLSCDA